MKIIYRTSAAGYPKVKPYYVTNHNCLANALKHFCECNTDWLLIADNILTTDPQYNGEVMNVSIGHGAGTFNLALNEALKLSGEEVVYFIENDYIHKKYSKQVLEEGFALGADYVSLYDHPDKYVDGVNPYVEGGGEVTKVFLTKSCHWKLTNSTTMTFAAKVKTLRRDEEILRKWTNGNHPHDFQMFLELREAGRSLITPIPGYATHGETAWLTPLTQWEKEI